MKYYKKSKQYLEKSCTGPRKMFLFTRQNVGKKIFFQISDIPIFLMLMFSKNDTAPSVPT